MSGDNQNKIRLKTVRSFREKETEYMKDKINEMQRTILCIYHKKYKIIEAVRYTTTVIFPHAAHNLTCNKRYGPLPHKGWRSMLSTDMNQLMKSRT
jgi:hypothetical protein